MVRILAPYALFIGLPVILLAAYWFWFYHKNTIYRFSSLIPLHTLETSTNWRKRILFLLRLGLLGALCFAIARFQSPDERSKIPVQGIDIMLVLDASESMDMIDEGENGKSRIDSAREQALKFIDKRDNDPIGLVIFSGAAVSRCPLTLDKRVLKEILAETTTSSIKIQGTVLSQAVLTAANRLKKSAAKSRIIIALTDGEPRGDIKPEIAIDIAKKLGIKIYTIGIGSETPVYFHTPFGPQMMPPINIPLLEKFAHETGGQFFMAHNAAEMEAIYDAIDKLERTDYETPIFSRYFEYFMPLLWIALALLISELLLTCLWWVRL